MVARRKPAWVMPIDRSDNDNGRQRDVVIHKVTRGKKAVSLVFQDSQFASYRVPLGKIDVVPETEERAEWDNIIVPVVPVRYTTYSEDIGDMGSTPILRTLQRSLIMGKRSVYVKAKKLQSGVQAGCR